MEEKTLNALRWIIGVLNTNGIQYQISGGFAAKLYGSPRKLNDIDIDISERFFSKILPEIKAYITFGPERFKDGKWDLELVTLNYFGQEIDLGGIDSAQISNFDRSKWITLPPLSPKTQDIEVEGVWVKVIPPHDLIAYKEQLDGAHQIIDIQAIRNYRLRNGL